MNQRFIVVKNKNPRVAAAGWKVVDVTISRDRGSSINGVAYCFILADAVNIAYSLNAVSEIRRAAGFTGNL